jgi:hypothetical protein
MGYSGRVPTPLPDASPAVEPDDERGDPQSADRAELAAKADPEGAVATDLAGVGERVRRTSQWGRCAMVAIAVHGLVAPAWTLEWGPALRDWIAGIYVASSVAAVFLFTTWLRRAHGDGRALGATAMRFTEARAVTAFFVPFVLFVRPYEVLRALFVASDPTTVPDVPRYRVIEAGYRSSAGEAISPPRWRSYERRVAICQTLPQGSSIMLRRSP